MKNHLISLLAMLSLLVSFPAAADLDVVFLLDTTGSMASEIREVKERVVQLSSALSESRKGETVRFGVVAYRDRKDDYLTKLSPLSADVAVSERFLGILNADGGGDAPEDVLTGLKVALTKLKWHSGARAERQIFLIGDAPPHLDYSDGPKPEALIALAQKKKIVVNAIGCRSLSRTGIQFFRKLAYATEGSYQHIGRVRSGETGVAAAMLKTLVPKVSEMDMSDATPISLTLEDSVDTVDSEVILVQRVDDAKKTGSCSISIHWPRGLKKAVPPKAMRNDNTLVVILEPTEGKGGTEQYRLSDCSAIDAVVHVQTGGAK